MKWIFTVSFCIVKFIQSDSPSLECGHIGYFNKKSDAKEYYNALQKLSIPDSMILTQSGICSVKFDSIIKK